MSFTSYLPLDSLLRSLQWLVLAIICFLFRFYSTWFELQKLYLFFGDRSFCHHNANKQATWSTQTHPVSLRICVHCADVEKWGLFTPFPSWLLLASRFPCVEISFNIYLDLTLNYCIQKSAKYTFPVYGQGAQSPHMPLQRNPSNIHF